MHKIKTLFMLGVIVLSGCQGTGSSQSSLEAIKPENLVIETASGLSEELLLGDTLQLVVKASNEGALLDVYWTSSDNTVALVSENGLVSPVEIGSVTIEAVSTLDTTIKATKEIHVKRQPGYRIMNGSDTLLQETNALYKAIIYSAQNSKSSDKLYVLDENNVEVFRYTTLEKYYCYLGETYQKTVTTSEEAAAFVKRYKNAYVIDGRGQNFTHLSQTTMPTRSNIDGELFSGSYMYAYSKTGNQMGTEGFAYVKFTLELSKMKMRMSDNMVEQGWNAYIFVPIVTTYPWSFCDIGLIHGGGSTPGYWNVIFNNNGKMNSKEDGLATIMTYNEAEDYYQGTEDLVIEAYVTEEAYCLNLTNLATGQTRFYSDPRPQHLELNTRSIHVILAASYCPVMSGTKVWDPRSGITMENVRFINPIMKKYRADADYAKGEAFDLVTHAPGTEYTLLQQPDNVTLDYGTVGGDTFMDVSIFYDSRERSHL